MIGSIGHTVMWHRHGMIYVGLAIIYLKSRVWVIETTTCVMFRLLHSGSWLELCLRAAPTAADATRVLSTCTGEYVPSLSLSVVLIYLNLHQWFVTVTCRVYVRSVSLHPLCSVHFRYLSTSNSQHTSNIVFSSSVVFLRVNFWMQRFSHYSSSWVSAVGAHMCSHVDIHRCWLWRSTNRMLSSHCSLLVIVRSKRRPWCTHLLIMVGNSVIRLLQIWLPTSSWVSTSGRSTDLYLPAHVDWKSWTMFTKLFVGKGNHKKFGWETQFCFSTLLRTFPLYIWYGIL